MDLVNPLSIAFLVSAFIHIIVGLWILWRATQKSQRLYGLLCFVTAAWQGSWPPLIAPENPAALHFAALIGYTAIIASLAMLHQLAIELTQAARLKKQIVVGYVFALGFIGLLWNSFIIKGNRIAPWGSAAQATLLHPLLILALVVGVIRILIILQTPSDAKMFNRSSAIVAVVVYALGFTDLLSSYGLTFWPVSYLFTVASLILFTYDFFHQRLWETTEHAEKSDERIRRHAAAMEMTRLTTTIAFPLVSQGELLGYLLLGEKMSEESYSKEDVLLLRIVANQAALAYQRVRYMELAVRAARTDMLAEIAGGFAHEIKTPLANISLPAELTFLDLAEVEEGKRSLQEVLPELKQRMRDIMAQTVKASEKIEAIRQFSKPGQVPLGPVKIGDVLAGSLTLLEHLIQKSGIRLEISVPDTIAPIRGNPKQLEIVFVNMVKNATEAMISHSTDALAKELKIRAFEEGEWVFITFKDSGPGIKRTDVHHLFEAYFTTKGSTGTGVGLFLSQQVIKAHGGSIDVQSEEGRGAEFIIRLPRYMEGTPYNSVTPAQMQQQ